VSLLDLQSTPEKQKEEKKEKTSIGRYIFDFIKLIVFAVVFVWLIHNYIFQPFVVFGPSMEPNFYNGDYLIIEKVSYYFRQPKRGEVVVFDSPQKKGDFLIKRVVGLPNERVEIKNGKIFIYNQDYPEGIELKENDYLPNGYSTSGQIDYSLKDNEYFLLGDNRYVSLDSRSFGPIPKDKIIGHSLIRGWPIRAFEEIKEVEYNF